MTSGQNSIRDGLEKAILALADERGQELALKIRPILLANLDRNRVEWFMNGDPDRLREYVWRVADGYVSLNTHLHDIQSARTEAVWKPLFAQMQKWAFNFLIRKGRPRDSRTEDLAAECATEAALQLLNAHFPYDVEFDAWMHMLVQNACRKQFRNENRKSNIPEENLVDLNDMLEDMPDAGVEDGWQTNDLSADLPEALGHLTESRRRVVEAIYFDGRKPAEIAAEMGKRVSAVHSLLFNALRDLRKILIKLRNNVND